MFPAPTLIAEELIANPINACFTSGKFLTISSKTSKFVSAGTI